MSATSRNPASKCTAAVDFAMTIVITWAGVWSVAKYVLVFGAGFAVCLVWQMIAAGRAMGRAFGW